MRSKRSLIKFIFALVALGFAFWMNLIYDKTIFSSEEPSKTNTEAVRETNNYSYKEISKICEQAATNKTIKYEEIILEFTPPAPTEERKTNCPWSRGDNLAPRADQVMARFEQLRAASLPEKAVVCSLDIKMDPTKKSFEHKDFYILSLNGVVLSTDAEFLLKLFREEETRISAEADVRYYLYDWARILGARRPASLAENDRREYCIGRDLTLSSCNLSHEASPYFKLSDPLAQWLGSRGIGPNQRYTMIITGDKDEAADCSHSGFKLKANYGYVID